MIFPKLKNKKFGYLNLDLEAQKWLKENNKLKKIASNPFLNPTFCQKFVNKIHKKYSLDFSYGGWMEDRTIIWRDSYLDKNDKFIHLGIDINVPVNTEIALNFNAKIVRIDDDYPEEFGWGPRVIFENLDSHVYVIYAHLDRDIQKYKIGQKLKKGQIFAKVGSAPYNGNWFPHVHVQIISKDCFNKIEKENLWQTLDGYGFTKDYKKDTKDFPDPLQFISFN